jgi:DNA-binding NarL/FixJ family response regulator
MPTSNGPAGRCCGRRARHCPGTKHGHRATPPALAALGVTDREAEVLALVTEGLTSKQIAARLFLSVRTVDKRVERLLAKTGVSRRAELRTFRT